MHFIDDRSRLRLTEPLENVRWERHWQPAISRSSWLLGSMGRSEMIRSSVLRTLLSIMSRDALKEGRITTKFSDRTPAYQRAGARQQAAREARPPAAEHFMVTRLAATPS